MGSVKCARLYIIIINFFPSNALSIKPQTITKLSSQITSESLSCSLFVYLLYNILELNPQAQGN